ncbi:MAG: cyclic nucleotide-binding domain-containing protein [Desulfobacter sp.]|nr:MAG: cyclic nucleotide-binding domain-containing protein [Desulfobacter sp.]
METLDNVLNKSVVFSGLAAADADRIKSLFQKWELHTGDTLTCAGDQAQFFFLLEKGTLLLALEEDKGVVLDAPGDFAAMEILSREGRYVATITALERGTAWIIPRQDFLDFIQEDTPGAAAVMEGWQSFLDDRAPFAKQITDIDIPAMY